MLLEKLNVNIELESNSEIERFKAMGYKEVGESKIKKSKKGKNGDDNGDDNKGSKE